nr:helix-turn-helix domain-containing protein [Urechidicola croceus]
MDFYGLTATALADSISIQRSSISHLLSGRNKPSLDFVLKVLDKYPEVELYWLLNGKGAFPKKSIDLPPTKPKTDQKIKFEKPELNLNTNSGENNEIEKIVIFYKNGTFKSYLP